MKLYVILKHGRDVVAISEEEKDVMTYILAKNFSTDDYHYTKIKGSMAERLMLDYEELYLEHDEKLDLVLTRVEHKIIDDILGEEKARIATTVCDLKHYLRNYSLSKKEKSTLKQSLKIIGSMKKTKRLRKIIKLGEFVSFLNRSKNIVDLFKDKIKETADRLYIFINVKE